MELPVVWLLGGPGSGKGTQSDLIFVKFGFSHLSTGDLLRNEVMSGTVRGQELFATMHAGQLVEDEEVVTLLAEAMARKEKDTKGFVIDGFPATMAQARLFEERLGRPTKIIVLEMNPEVLKGRLRERNNFDDQPTAIQERISSFSQETRPVIQTYAKSAVKVNADRAADDVFTDICKILAD